MNVRFATSFKFLCLLEPSYCHLVTPMTAPPAVVIYFLLDMLFDVLMPAKEGEICPNTNNLIFNAPQIHEPFYSI